MKLQTEDEKLIEKTVDPDIRFHNFLKMLQKEPTRDLVIKKCLRILRLMFRWYKEEQKKKCSFPRIVLNEALTVKNTQANRNYKSYILTLLYLVETVSFSMN